MTYNAYERDAGTSVIQAVEAHCRHLTSGGTFGMASTPSLAQVEQMIDRTYYDLYARLAEGGYDPAVATTATAALGFLEGLNTFGAVMRVELAHPITGRGGEPNDRYREYADQYREGIAILASDALEEMGVERTTALSARVGLGGTSLSEKRDLYEDSDAVQARFRRGFGRDPAAATDRDVGTV